MKLVAVTKKGGVVDVGGGFGIDRYFVETTNDGAIIYRHGDRRGWLRVGRMYGCFKSLSHVFILGKFFKSMGLKSYD